MLPTLVIKLGQRLLAGRFVSLILFACLLFGGLLFVGNEQVHVMYTLPQHANIARALADEFETLDSQSNSSASADMDEPTFDMSLFQINRTFELGPFPTSDPSEPKTTNIVMLKTHKTGSTTLASILFRFGSSHQLRFLIPHYHYIDFTRKLPNQPDVNISLYHHIPTLNTDNITIWYTRKIPNATFITIVREPVTRALSEFYYMHQPERPSTSLHSWLTNTTQPLQRRLHHMSYDLGVFSETDMEYFLSEGHKKFAHILVLEKFDESLVLMRRMFNWHPDEVLYFRLLEACKDRKRSWDSLPVKCSKNEHLNTATINLLKNAVMMDNKIYKLALRRLQALLDVQPQDFWFEVAALKKKLQDLNKICGEAEESWFPMPLGERRCSIFRMNDLQFEKIIKISRGLVKSRMMNIDMNPASLRRSNTRVTRRPAKSI